MRRLNTRTWPSWATPWPRARRKRRRARPGLTRRGYLLCAAAAASLTVVGGLGWLWHDGWFGRQIDAAVAAFYRSTVEAGLAVDEVFVEGRWRTAPSEILRLLEVERGAPILAFDPYVAKSRLEGLPWVRAASVERRLPDVIYLRLDERVPLAIWQIDGARRVIDDRGAVIPEARAEAFAALPVVVGKGAPDHTAALLRLLDLEPDLKRQVSAAVWVGERRWNIRLDSGIDVRLPETDPERAWAELARIDRQHGLLDRDVAIIDLRLPDRLVVRTAPGAAARVGDKVAGKDT